MEAIRKSCRILLGKQTGKPRRWEDNNKKDLMEIGRQVGGG
jgi:hypothetical protein